MTAGSAEGSMISARIISTASLDIWYADMAISPDSFPETTHVTKLEPNTPVSLHLVGFGCSACSRAEKQISRDESACRLQTTDPSPAPASSKSVQITPTSSSPQCFATPLIFCLFSQGFRETPSTSSTCG